MNVTYKKLNYHPWAHNKFNKIFKQHNTVLTSQTKYFIENILNSNMKDHIPPEKKSGIHQIKCKDCEQIYTGKTKKEI